MVGPGAPPPLEYNTPGAHPDPEKAPLSSYALLNESAPLPLGKL